MHVYVMPSQIFFAVSVVHRFVSALFTVEILAGASELLPCLAKLQVIEENLGLLKGLVTIRTVLGVLHYRSISLAVLMVGLEVVEVGYNIIMHNSTFFAHVAFGMGLLEVCFYMLPWHIFTQHHGTNWATLYIGCPKFVHSRRPSNFIEVLQQVFQ